MSHRGHSRALDVTSTGLGASFAHLCRKKMLACGVCPRLISGQGRPTKGSVMFQRWGSRTHRRSLPLTAALTLLASLVPATALVATVPGTALAASPGQQEVYVATDPGTSGGTGMLYALSAANPATTIFSVQSAPDFVTVSPDSSTAYVNGDATDVTQVNTLTGTTGTIATPRFPGVGPMAMSPDGSMLYISTPGG